MRFQKLGLDNPHRGKTSTNNDDDASPASDYSPDENEGMETPDNDDIADQISENFQQEQINGKQDFEQSAEEKRLNIVPEDDDSPTAKGIRSKQPQFYDMLVPL